MSNLITPQNLWSEMLKFKHLLNLDYGFTIPFIVGAYYEHGFLNDKDLLSPLCIKYLLNNILESTTDRNPVKIFGCSELSNEPVLQYLNTMLSESDTKDQMNWNSNIDNKIYWHHMETSITDLDSLINWLWTKPTARGGMTYRELISSKQFSCYKGGWNGYSNIENKFIRNIHILDTIDKLSDL